MLPAVRGLPSRLLTRPPSRASSAMAAAARPALLAFGDAPSVDMRAPFAAAPLSALWTGAAAASPVVVSFMRRLG